MPSYRIKPSKLKGTIVVPSSKSHTMRAILLAFMGKKKSVVHNYLPSPDTDAMIAAVRSLGAKVHSSSTSLVIEGVGGKPLFAKEIISAKNSGQVLRFIGAMAALSPYYTVITGDDSLCHNRPHLALLSGLSQLGAFAVSAKNGFAPIGIRGPMHPGKAIISGEDSQPVSALLMACSFLPGKTILEVKNPKETPWIDLTLDWMQRLRMRVEHKNYENYQIEGNAAYEGFEREIPGDFSSAAYPIAAALITGSELTLENLDMEDIQGDKVFLKILEEMGAKITIDKKKITIQKGSALRGMRIDGNRCIDLVTIFAVIASFAEGKTEIFNAAIARKKESDRLFAITEELKKMGANIEEKEDGLVIFPAKLKGSIVKSHHDHRIAMSLAVGALGAEGETVIEEISCIAKSYPTFLEDFRRAGVDIS